jgi:hypothetical protein
MGLHGLLQEYLPTFSFYLNMKNFDIPKQCHVLTHDISIKSAENFIIQITIRPYYKISRDSVVGIATSYGLDDRGV